MGAAETVHVVARGDHREHDQKDDADRLRHLDDLFRRLASSTTMEAAQMRPSTVKGSSRAVGPDSPWARTNS